MTAPKANPDSIPWTIQVRLACLEHAAKLACCATTPDQMVAAAKTLEDYAYDGAPIAPPEIPADSGVMPV